MSQPHSPAQHLAPNLESCPILSSHFCLPYYPSIGPSLWNWTIWVCSSLNNLCISASALWLFSELWISFCPYIPIFKPFPTFQEPAKMIPPSRRLLDLQSIYLSTALLGPSTFLLYFTDRSSLYAYKIILMNWYVMVSLSSLNMSRIRILQSYRSCGSISFVWRKWGQQKQIIWLWSHCYSI